MVLSICNFRSTLVSKIENIRGIGFLCLMTAVVASAVFMTGCSSAVGTDLAPREDILKTLRAQGFVFNKNVISTVFGENQNQVIVSGQIAQKTPDNKNVSSPSTEKLSLKMWMEPGRSSRHHRCSVNSFLRASTNEFIIASCLFSVHGGAIDKPEKDG